jgi:DNA-binding transcriptional MerR regulator
VADEGLSAGAVARRLGVAVTTLRTWHQRYGLGPSRHVPGHHRRYTADDLARLEIMRRLTVQGIAPAEAARWAHLPAGSTIAPDTPDAGNADAGNAGAGDAALPEPTDPDVAAEPDELDAPDEAAEPEESADAIAPTGRAGGGFAIPLGRATPAARGLARAAMRLDAPAMRDVLLRYIAERGVVATWDTVVRPVLFGLGERHAATSALIEVEHLVSRTVSEVLGAVPRPPSGGPPPTVLLACADEEQHSLPLEALAAALAEKGVPCRMLGGRVPPGALRDAVARTGPRAVVLWAHLTSAADPAQLTALTGGPDRPLLVAAAGPGWRAGTLPDGVLHPASLAEAVTIMMAANADNRTVMG